MLKNNLNKYQKVLGYMVYTVYIYITINNTSFMNAYLIQYKDITSEWIATFASVQEFMNNLEKEGIVSNVKVQKFVNSLLVKELTFNFNGQSWEQI